MEGAGGFEAGGFFFGAPLGAARSRSAKRAMISSISVCTLRTSCARSWKVRNALLKPPTSTLRTSLMVRSNCLAVSTNSFVTVVSVISRLSVLMVTRRPKSR